MLTLSLLTSLTAVAFALAAVDVAVISHRYRCPPVLVLRFLHRYRRRRNHRRQLRRCRYYRRRCGSEFIIVAVVIIFVIIVAVAVAVIIVIIVAFFYQLEVGKDSEKEGHELSQCHV